MADHEVEEQADYEEQEDIYEGVAEEGGGEDDGENQNGLEKSEDEIKEIEEELMKLDRMQHQVEQKISTAANSLDENSIYVGQVEYEATQEELRAHFAPCGTINRLTIMCNKATGMAKGFAYIEFLERDAVERALKLNDSTFKGRQLKVLPKRENVYHGGVRGGRGGRGGRVPYGGGRGVFIRGGGAGFRGRGRGPPRGGYRGGGYRGGRGGRHAPYYNSYY